MCFFGGEAAAKTHILFCARYLPPGDYVKNCQEVTILQNCLAFSGYIAVFWEVIESFLAAIISALEDSSYENFLTLSRPAIFRASICHERIRYPQPGR